MPVILPHFQSIHRALSPIVHDRTIQYRIRCLSVNDRQSAPDAVNSRRESVNGCVAKKSEKKVRVYCDHQYKMKKRTPVRRRGEKRGRIVFISTYAALISQSLPLLFLRVRPNILHDEYARVYNNVRN